MPDHSVDAAAVFQFLGTPGIGWSRHRALIERAFKVGTSVGDVLRDKDKLKMILTVHEINAYVSYHDYAESCVARLMEDGIAIVTFDDPRYPGLLKKKLGSAAPPALLCRGELALLSTVSVGFCGSRKASDRGLAVARDCAEQLSAAGTNVVSGYAAGVDLETHRTALRAGGTTTIVLPEGLDHFRIRRDLKTIWDWARILVVSQFFPSVPWSVQNAMKRNEVIAGLSHGLIVIEAGASGGSIEAGRVGLARGVSVYAPLYDGMPEEAAGNDELIRLGAKPIRKQKSTDRAKLDELFGEIRRPIGGEDLFSYPGTADGSSE